MKIKYYVQHGEDAEDMELLQEHNRNIHVSTMILSANSLQIDDLLYDVIESILCLEEDEIQITLEVR